MSCDGVRGGPCCDFCGNFTHVVLRRCRLGNGEMNIEVDDVRRLHTIEDGEAGDVWEGLRVFS